MAISLAAPFVLAGMFQNQPFSASVGVTATSPDSSATLILQNFTGTTPPGITITLGSGGTVLTASGTPTTLGNYSFGLEIHNTASPNTTITVSLQASVTVVPSTPVPQTPNPMNLPGGIIISRFNIIVPAFVYSGALWQFTTEQDTTQISGDSDISGHIAVYKGTLTGNGSPWVPQDYANNPLYSWDYTPYFSMSAQQNPAALNELIVCFMGSTGFPTPDTPTSVFIKIFDMNTGMWRATSSAGPAVNYSASARVNELLDLNMAVLPNGTVFVRYERITDSGPTFTVQYSIYDPASDTWTTLDSTYDSGSGFPGGDISLLCAPDGTVTDLYINGALAWFQKKGATTYGPSLVPSGGVPSQQGFNRVQGIYYPPTDSVWFPLAYSNTWVLVGSPAINPTSWVLTEISAKDNPFSALVLGPDGKTVVYVWEGGTTGGTNDTIYISIFTGGAWGPPTAVANLLSLFGISVIQDGIQAVLIGNDIGITFGANQTVSGTTYDSVAFFLRIPLVFPQPTSALTVACPVNNTGTVGVPYSGQIIASGGTPPYTYMIISV